MLVLAQAQDDTADLIVAALASRRVRVARVDTADFPDAITVVARPDLASSPGWLYARGERVDLASVCSVYRRHSARFGFPEGMSTPEQRFATQESSYGLGGVFAAQPRRWLDHPAAVADASFKPRQLRVAAKVGLTVPASLVTNSGAEARAFVAEVGGPVVYKSLYSGVVSESDELQIIYTSVLDESHLDDNRDAAIALCPILLQSWVPKSFYVRLPVVGVRVFAVPQQAKSRTAKIDWRARYEDLKYEVYSTPEAVRAGVLAFLSEFRLRFGAFDFSVAQDGCWSFLECNPAGQWAWIAEETRLPIAEAIADELVGGG